ncbi:MAG: NlpC/P60 family protein [Lachnospiraceae bacterium]|nr:NlpC/P60 family protein [Lachnospiraceae bacterium]
MEEKEFRRIASYFIIICFVLGSLFIVGEKNVAASYTRYVKADSLSIRKAATTSSGVVGHYTYGTKVTCYGTSGSWTKVKYKGNYRYVSSNYLVTKKPDTIQVSASSSKNTQSTSSYTRYVTASSLTIRKKASVSSASVGTYRKGDKVTCYGTSGNWTKVKVSGTICYVSTNYLSSSKPSSSSSKSSVSGTTIANSAKKYAGRLRYVWGGESLTKGADCSGFTKAIYAQYGYSLPHSACGQRSSGRSVSSSNRQPGDLVCYTAVNGNYHVGIYIGNNQVVHASSPSTGVRISTWNYRKVYCVRRIVK